MKAHALLVGLLVAQLLIFALPVGAEPEQPMAPMNASSPAWVTITNNLVLQANGICLGNWTGDYEPARDLAGQPLDVTGRIVTGVRSDCAITWKYERDLLPMAYPRDCSTGSASWDLAASAHYASLNIADRPRVRIATMGCIGEWIEPKSCGWSNGHTNNDPGSKACTYGAYPCGSCAQVWAQWTNSHYHFNRVVVADSGAFACTFGVNAQGANPSSNEFYCGFTASENTDSAWEQQGVPVSPGGMGGGSPGAM